MKEQLTKKNSYRTMLDSARSN